MDITDISTRYSVRRLDKSDVADIYALCSKNTLYYRHCPPFVTERGIYDDMEALPPGKEVCDKLYLGFYDGADLVAVLDLILGFPNDKTAYIGFFMTETSVQNAGVGSGIIDELCVWLKRAGFSSVRLGWVSGNAQAERFWLKNGFIETGEIYDKESFRVVAAMRGLISSETDFNMQNAQKR